MEQMKRRITALLAFCAAVTLLQAQDPLFTQFQYAPTYMNPGLIGGGKNNLRLSALSKVQWFNLYKPFKYFNGGADLAMYDANQRNILNIGMNVNHSSKGYLSHTNISGLVGRSFGTNTSDCSDWYLSLALQAGVNFSRVNPNQFVFIDQLDQTGIIGAPSQVDLFQTFNSKTYFDFSSGFVFSFRDFMLGGAVHHMNEPNISFSGKPEDGKLLRKVTGHLSYRYENDLITLKPTLISQFQGKSAYVCVGTLIDYYELPIELGLWYRNANGMGNNSAFCVGFSWKWGEATAVTSRKKEYSGRMGVSYDADVNRPGFNTTHGSMEFGIQKEFITNDNRICPTSQSGICNYRFPWEFF